MPAVVRWYEAARLALAGGIGVVVAGTFSLQHLGVILDETGATGDAPLYGLAWLPLLFGGALTLVAGATALVTGARARRLIRARRQAALLPDRGTEPGRSPAA